MKLTINGKSYEVALQGDSIVVDGRRYQFSVEGEGRRRIVHVDGHDYVVELPETPGGSVVLVDAKAYELDASDVRPVRTPMARRQNALTVRGAITARMVGRVLHVNIKVGDTVQENDLLLVLEAMKMENEIRAPHAGRVTDVQVSPGQRVAEGDTLVVLE